MTIKTTWRTAQELMIEIQLTISTDWKHLCFGNKTHLELYALDSSLQTHFCDQGKKVRNNFDKKLSQIKNLL